MTCISIDPKADSKLGPDKYILAVFSMSMRAKSHGHITSQQPVEQSSSACAPPIYLQTLQNFSQDWLLSWLGFCLVKKRKKRRKVARLTPHIRASPAYLQAPQHFRLSPKHRIKHPIARIFRKVPTKAPQSIPRGPPAWRDIILAIILAILASYGPITFTVLFLSIPCLCL